MTMEIRDLAIDYRSRFEKRQRGNGDEFWCVKDGCSTPDLADLIEEAHGNMGADDYRYEFIVEALDAIAEHDDEEAARDSIESDIYTHELTGWLDSRADRCAYCDEYAEQFGVEGSKGEFLGTFTLLQMGQLSEKLEVCDSVLESLHTLCDDAQDGEEV